MLPSGPQLCVAQSLQRAALHTVYHAAVNRLVRQVQKWSSDPQASPALQVYRAAANLLRGSLTYGSHNQAAANQTAVNQAAACKQLREENLEKITHMERKAAAYDGACDYYSRNVEEAAAQCGPWLEWSRKGREDLGLPNAPLDGTESVTEKVQITMHVAQQYPAPTSTPVGQMMADAASSSAALNAYLEETQQTLMDFTPIPSGNRAHPNTSGFTSSQRSTEADSSEHSK